MISRMAVARISNVAVIGLFLSACGGVPSTKAGAPDRASEITYSNRGGKPEPSPCIVIDEPLTDQNGDGRLTQRDTYLREYAHIERGENICVEYDRGMDRQRVIFDFDQDALNDTSKKILDEAVDVMKEYPELKVEVAGYTDSIGSTPYNQRLSTRRARAAYAYLVERGIDPSRLIGPIGYGEARPIAPEHHEDGSDDPEGRAKNRRIELNPETD